MSKYLAEAIATFALVFVGAGSVLVGADLLSIALAHGLVLAAMIYATMHISGAHINPAVSIAMLATGRMRADEAGKYIVSQLAGGVIAAYLLSVIYSGILPSISPSVNNLASVISPVTGILIEAILTFFLVFVIFATAVDKRSSSHHAALAIGFVLIFNHIIALTLTGASMNPARTFGPALVSGMWTNHLVYWIGPIAGALVAAFLYQKAFIGKKR